MKKLFAALIAACFALVTAGSFAASHMGAQPMKDGKKDEMKKEEGKKGEMKKDEMKKEEGKKGEMKKDK
jgi:pentapeptide MXKDX repeat protein